MTDSLRAVSAPSTTTDPTGPELLKAFRLALAALREEATATEGPDGDGPLWWAYRRAMYARVTSPSSCGFAAGLISGRNCGGSADGVARALLHFAEFLEE